MAEQTKWHQIRVTENCMRCGSGQDVRQAYDSETERFGSEPLCVTCRAAQSEAAPAQVAEPENHAPNGDWKAGFGFSEPTSSSAPQIPAGEEELCGGHCGRCDETHADWEREILQLRAALAAERERTREEDCKAVCPLCAGQNKYVKPASLIDGFYFHEWNDAPGIAAKCKAADIRALSRTEPEAQP